MCTYADVINNTDVPMPTVQPRSDAVMHAVRTSVSDSVNTPLTNFTFPFSFKVLYSFNLIYDAERVRKVMILRKKIGMLDKLQHGES
jgi:hypothetical protein